MTDSIETWRAKLSDIAVRLAHVFRDDLSRDTCGTTLHGDLQELGDYRDDMYVALCQSAIGGTLDSCLHSHLVHQRIAAVRLVFNKLKDVVMSSLMRRRFARPKCM